MTTSVKIIAHNNPWRVTVMDRTGVVCTHPGAPEEGNVNGYTVILKDGQSHDTHVTDTRTVLVEELSRA